MKRFLILSALCSLLSAHAPAQTKTVTKTISTNAITESLTFPSGKTLTIAPGATLNATGATITGITTSAAWADITGKPTEFPPAAHTQAISTITGLQTALDAKAAITALDDYLPTTGGTIVGPLSINSMLELYTSGGANGFRFDSQQRQMTVYSGTGASLILDAGSLTGNSQALWPNVPVGFVKTLATTSQADGHIDAADVTGLATSATVDTTNASNIGSGTLALARLPYTPATLGANTFTGMQQFSGTTHAGLRLNNLTTTQRDAIASPQAGMIVWNSTTGRMSVHDGSAWTSGMVRLSGDTMTGQLQITQGTIAASAPLNITQTWNSGTPGTGAFSMLTLNATLTNASSTSSGFLTCIRDGTTRFFMDSGGVSYFGGSTAGTATCVIDPNNTTLSLRSNAYLNWMGDTYLYRDGTASNLQMGIDAASPVAQIFKAHDGSGTNIDGASLTLSGGRSTGTGDDGDVILRTTMTGSSGSSLNTPQTRQHIQARFVNLTESTATNIASISLPSGRVTGGTATITIWASDGTDFQAVTRDVTFNAVNKAGVITTSAASGLSAAVVDSSGSGSLTATFDTSSSGNNLLLRINATSSLTQTILRARLVITALNGDDVQTVTPQ